MGRWLTLQSTGSSWSEKNLGQTGVAKEAEGSHFYLSLSEIIAFFGSFDCLLKFVAVDFTHFRERRRKVLITWNPR